MQTDVLIVGGGLAGLAAAQECAFRGLKVNIADESWSLGGQLRQQTQILANMPAPYQNKRGFEVIEELVPKLDDLLVQRLLGHTLIGEYADGRYGLSNAERVISIKPTSTVIATGAAESPVAFPGWTLPGIMTIGASQILMNRERVYPGKRALVIGASDFALEVVQQMHDVGIEIAGIVEVNPSRSSTNQGLWDTVSRHQISVYKESVVMEAKGRGRVEEVRVGSLHDPKMNLSIPADLVCLDGGLHPILEPFTILNCNLAFERELGGWIPVYSNELQTSREGVYAAGNAAGLTSQAGIYLTGIMAGIGAARRAGAQNSTDNERMESLWEMLYQVENDQLLLTWEARLRHIEKSVNTAYSVTANGGKKLG